MHSIAVIIIDAIIVTFNKVLGEGGVIVDAREEEEEEEWVTDDGRSEFIRRDINGFRVLFRQIQFLLMTAATRTKTTTEKTCRVRNAPTLQPTFCFNSLPSYRRRRR